MSSIQFILFGLMSYLTYIDVQVKGQGLTGAACLLNQCGYGGILSTYCPIACASAGYSCGVGTCGANGLGINSNSSQCLCTGEMPQNPLFPLIVIPALLCYAVCPLLCGACGYSLNSPCTTNSSVLSGTGYLIQCNCT